MTKKQKRGNAYYEERLIRDYPTIYADLVDGKYRTVTEATKASGLKKPRTRLQELKNAWSKSTNSERKDFLAWLTTTGVLPTGSSSAGATATSISTGRYLLPATVARINHIKAKRGISAGEIMDEMGFTKLDPSLGLALSKGYGLRLSVIAALEKWLTANSSV
ncbi:hypothetical protein [Mesorhizobium sp. 1B3]|uniref:hypothetical protein n=1 Tax=Mesorhizobium sp. 1B3 TaxID=3243599 RepID=UPI003D97B60D